MSVPLIPKTILVVEDGDDDYEVLDRSFKKVGIKNSLTRVESGDLALDYLYQRNGFDAASAPRPGLVLLDLNMPGIDGRDVLKQIKADPKLKAIPVFILSTSNAEKDIAECYEYGANSYIAKPTDFDSFVDAVKRMKNFVFEIILLPKND